MTIKLSIVLVIALCCLALSQEARANRVIVNTDVYYDSTQNRMVGYTEASSSYLAGMYYCLSVTVYVFSNDGQWAGNSAWDGCLYGYARTEATLPYDPNAEYSVDGEHTAEPYYRNDLGELIDQYNFQTYAEGIPVYYPSSYEFLGPGPRRPSIGSILLGTAFALFSQGTRHGPPDHVKVLSDTGNSVRDRDCGFPDRRIRVQIVDSQGRRAVALAQPVSVRERFFSTGGSQMSSVCSSCTGQCTSPSGCQLQYFGGIFDDHITAGCPPPPFPFLCGIPEFVNKWVWCPRGRPEKVLATNVYNVTDLQVLINGQQQYSPGDELW